MSECLGCGLEIKPGDEIYIVGDEDECQFLIHKDIGCLEKACSAQAGVFLEERDYNPHPHLKRIK